MTSKKFIFVRHGEAEHNRAYHENGNDESVFFDEKYKDAKLTEKGIEQALEVGKKLAEKYPREPISIWCSPSTRAIQTAQEIFEEVCTTGCILLHDGLLEFQDGKHKCNQRKDAEELRKEFEYICDVQFLAEKPAVWSHSEPYDMLRNRMKMVIQLITDVDTTQTICIVSHRNALQALLGVQLGNCEIVEKTYEELLITPNRA